MMKHILSPSFFLGALFCTILASAQASAMLIPQPLATDPRIKVVAWAPNEVIKYTGYYKVQTSWEFAPDEEIGTISLGDSAAWTMNVLGSRLFIKPIEQDATTNMTIITNKRVYLVELHAAELKSMDDKGITWILRFVYPEDESNVSVSNRIDRVPDLETEDLSKFNFRYTVSGSEKITPLRIFDDGEFTYFEFRDKGGEIPAFYTVDSQNNEAIVNYRTRGPYIVVERVAPRYTLRSGNDVVCVFNEAMSSKRQPGGSASMAGSTGSSAVPASWQK